MKQRRQRMRGHCPNVHVAVQLTEGHLFKQQSKCLLSQLVCDRSLGWLSTAQTRTLNGGGASYRLHLWCVFVANRCSQSRRRGLLSVESTDVFNSDPATVMVEPLPSWHEAMWFFQTPAQSDTLNRPTHDLQVAGRCHHFAVCFKQNEKTGRNNPCTVAVRELGYHVYPQSCRWEAPQHRETSHEL